MIHATFYGLIQVVWSIIPGKRSFTKFKNYIFLDQIKSARRFQDLIMQIGNFRIYF